MVYIKINPTPSSRKKPSVPSGIILTLIVYIFFIHTSSASGTTAESVIHKMSDSQQEKLHSFQPVLLHADVTGGTSEVVVVRRVNAAPPRIANLFNDYTSAPRIFSSLSESKMIANSGPATTIDYTLRLPIPIKVTYRMQHLTTTHGPDLHSTKWQLVSSPVLEGAEGRIDFYPYKSGTLVYYRNKVTPVKLLQQAMKGQAPKEALKAVEELAKAAEEK